MTDTKTIQKRVRKGWLIGLVGMLCAGLAPWAALTPVDAATERLPIVGGDSSNNSMSARRAFDGKSSTSWRTQTSRPPRDAWVKFDLGAPREVASVAWKLQQTGFADRMKIERSLDGRNWATIDRTGNSPEGMWRSRRVNRDAQFIRFSFANPHRDPRLGYLSEVRVVGPAAVSAGMASLTATSSCQRVSVPAYFDQSTPHWNNAIDGAPSTELMFFSPNLGPDRYTEVWHNAVKRIQAGGVTALGYVLTAGGDRDMSLVKQDIKNYFEWFEVDGIYLDEGSSEVDDIPYYREAAEYVREIKPGAIVALNPGYTPDERYMNFIDIIEVYEFDYETLPDAEIPGLDPEV